MLLDFLNVALLLGGCWLLWLNLKPRTKEIEPSEDVQRDTAIIPAANIDDQLHTQLSEELSIAPQPAAIEAEREMVDAESGVRGIDRNSYAAHIASAVSKSRKPISPGSLR